MSYRAVLCHFCEKEGPTVLLTTSVDTKLRRNGEADENLVLQNLNCLPEIGVTMSSVKSGTACEFCHSVTEQLPFIVSWPTDTSVSSETAQMTFLSSRLPPGDFKALRKLEIFSFKLSIIFTSHVKF